jgi:hypothetical protein
MEYRRVPLPIPKHSSDDVPYLELICRILTGVASALRVDEVFIIGVDNWFDMKWRNFSGIGRVAFNGGGLLYPQDTALDTFRQPKTTFPPFSPKRILVVEQPGSMHDVGLHMPPQLMRDKACFCPPRHRVVVHMPILV